MSLRSLAATAAALAVLSAAPVVAQTAPASPPGPLVAGAQHDPAVPTLASVLGWASGQAITSPADARRYVEALAAHAPDRVRIGEYAVSHEGRPVYWVAIGSPRNIARLEEIKAASRALADPRVTSAAQAEAIIADQPAIVWLAYSVHGDEISGVDAGLATAHHLLASRDPAVRGWLDNTLVVIVPSQNPDGRNRFLNSFHAGLGVEPNPDPLSAERDQPWPGGRFNHDLFDLNRDWFIQTQPETRGHAAQVLDWRPQVLVDIHEMGTDETYFFPPEADPINPLVPRATLEMRETIGRNTARHFDRAGVSYFNRQVFDAFYPGFGDGWPAYLGAVSMTYEQGSARGLVARRSSGELLTYRDTVRNQTLSSLSTIEAASANRERLLRNHHAFGRDGVEGGRGAFVFGPNPMDPTAADKLAGLLTRSGVEVRRAEAGFDACGRAWPAGAYVVARSQPNRRMAEVLLTRDIPVPEAFMAEQEARRARGLGDQLYDVTAWSLPLMFNTPFESCGATPSVRTTAVTGELVRPGAVTNPQAAYGFLVAPGSAGQRLVLALLKDGVAARALTQGFTHASGDWPAGTVLIPRAGAPEDLVARLQTLAAATGARVQGVDESWTTSGPSFGSAEAVALRRPRVAMAWDEPAAPTAAGAARYVVEREFGLPVTAVRTPNLASADLSRFEVLILPDGGNYEGVLGEAGVANLRAWVERGGVLIGLGRASRLLVDEDAKLSPARRQTPAAGEAEDTPAALETEEQYRQAVLGGARPASVAGALIRGRADPDHWLAAGVAPELNLLVQGADVYAPLTRDQGVNVVRFRGPDELLASGQLWDENRRALAYKPAVMASGLGAGQVILFAQDPTVRGYLDGLKPLLMNAILLAPAVGSGGAGH